MSRFKRLLAVVLSVMMFATVIPMAALAGDNPTITVASVEAAAGDTVDVAIDISNNPGIISMLLDVAYDSNLTLTAVKNGTVLNGATHNVNALEANPYTLSWGDDTATSDNDSNGTIVTFTFKVSESATGELPITVKYDNSNAAIYNMGFETVDFDVVNGKVTVSGGSAVTTNPTITVASVEAAAGDTVDVAIDISNNPGIISMLLDVAYDSNLTLTAVKNGTVLNGATHNVNALEANPYTLSWGDDTATSDNDSNGTIVTFTFKVSESATGELPITVKYDNSNAAIYNMGFETVDFDVVNGKVTVSGGEVTPPTPVAVTGVTLDKSTLTLEIGGTETLAATVAPDDAANKAVTWTTSDANVATVTDGVVTAVAAGTATITVTTADGGFTADCAVTVNAPVITPVAVTGVTLDKSTLTLDIDGTATLAATVAPDDAANKAVTWTTSDANVATVTDGVVTAVAAGTATITATTADGGFTADCAVTVNAPAPVAVTGVKLDQTSLTLEEGSTVQLIATVLPENATDKAVTWTTSDANVATVTDGVVKAVAAGTATITVTTADGGFTADCAVTVIPRQSHGTAGGVSTSTGGSSSSGGSGSGKADTTDKTDKTDTTDKTDKTDGDETTDGEDKTEGDEATDGEAGTGDPTKQITLTIGNPNAVVYGESVTNDVAPVIRNDRTMLPIRFIAEALGATVSWNGDTRVVTIVSGSVTIEITIDANTALVNGAVLSLDTPAFIEKDRTFLPIRFVSETLGAKVDWVDETKQVVITKE